MQFFLDKLPDPDHVLSHPLFSTSPYFLLQWVLFYFLLFVLWPRRRSTPMSVLCVVTQALLLLWVLVLSVPWCFYNLPFFRESENPNRYPSICNVFTYSFCDFSRRRGRFWYLWSVAFCLLFSRPFSAFPILPYSMVLPSGPGPTTFVFYFPIELPLPLGLASFFYLLLLLGPVCLTSQFTRKETTTSTGGSLFSHGYSWTTRYL